MVLFICNARNKLFLMNAYDKAIFSGNIHELQDMLNTYMLILLQETLLSVNVTKTKIVIFINGENIRNNEK